MTPQQETDAAALIARLDAALKDARVSATVHIVTVDGQPKLRIASRERGEALQRLNRAVASVLRHAEVDHRYLRTLEQQN